jgi:hypothetical protein
MNSVNKINGPVFTKKFARLCIGGFLRNVGASGSIIELVDFNKDFEVILFPASRWSWNGKKGVDPAILRLNGTIRVKGIGYVKHKGVFIPRKDIFKVKTVLASWYEPVRFASDEARDYVNKILGRAPYVAVSA